MLSADQKAEIQKGYRTFLDVNELRPRLGQKQMIAAIANGLAAIEEDAEGRRRSDNPVNVVEAGTGTGKTLAYLLATLPIARALGKKVVVATGTVALQEQLVNRDIPNLLSSTGWDYQVVLAKGRGRYLCPIRLEQCLDSASARDSGLFLFEDEIQFNPTANLIASYRAMNNSLAAGEWAGDRDSWPDSLEDSDWRPLTVDRRQCTGRRCRLIRNCCFFKARDELDEADCIVANHDLVMADLSLGGGAILPPPEETIYIFDEGHRIAPTALNHFAGSCRIRTTGNWLGRMQKQADAWLSLFRDAPDIVSRLEKLASSAADSERLMGLSYPLLEKYLEGAVEGGTELRWCFVDGDPGEEIRELAGHLVQGLGVLFSTLELLSDRLSGAMDEAHFPVPRVDLEQLFQQVGVWQGRIEGALRLWESYAREDDTQKAPPTARWLSLEEGAGNPDIRLSASPTDAGGIFRLNLWQRCYAAIITSATLQTLGSFENFSKRCGLPATTVYTAVAGAFDYANAGVIAVPDIGADGSDSQLHTEALISVLPEMIDWHEGTLVLFASRRQMELVYDGLGEERQDQVLVQGQWSHQEIVRRHRATIDSGEGSVIFGLASFAEGMDFPGNYCSHVVIAKLPFAVPDDPVYQTLSGWLEHRGENPFMQLMLPDASLRLHQACGRLIRTEKDRGRITILDRRIISKRYGKQMLDDLPPFRRETG